MYVDEPIGVAEDDGNAVRHSSIAHSYPADLSTPQDFLYSILHLLIGTPHKDEEAGDDISLSEVIKRQFSNETP
jgi:hypothetical protein